MKELGLDACMHGRGIICKHPVARITVTLTLASSLITASQRGLFGILFNKCLYADIVENVTRERHVDLAIARTSMRLNPSALVCNEKRFVTLLTYAQFDNHTRKHHVEHIREKFCVHKSQKQKQDLCGHFNKSAQDRPPRLVVVKEENSCC